MGGREYLNSSTLNQLISLLESPTVGYACSFSPLAPLSLSPLSDVLCMSAFIKQDDLSCRCEEKVMTTPLPSLSFSLSLFLRLWSKGRHCLSSSNWSGFTSPQTGEVREGWTAGSKREGGGDSGGGGGDGGWSLSLM